MHTNGRGSSSIYSGTRGQSSHTLLPTGAARLSVGASFVGKPGAGIALRCVNERILLTVREAPTAWASAGHRDERFLFLSGRPRRSDIAGVCRVPVEASTGARRTLRDVTTLAWQDETGNRIESASESTAPSTTDVSESEVFLSIPLARLPAEVSSTTSLPTPDGRQYNVLRHEARRRAGFSRRIDRTDRSRGGWVDPVAGLVPPTLTLGGACAEAFWTSGSKPLTLRGACSGSTSSAWARRRQPHA